MHEASHKIIINGEYKNHSEPVLTVDNRGYRYGDGVFETMTFMRGQLLHEAAHFERLFFSLQTLEYDIPEHWASSYFRDLVFNLCNINDLVSARVRLTAYRGNGLLGSSHTIPGFTIEATPLPRDSYLFKNPGIKVDIFRNAFKSCDKYSFIKSSNYLPSVMASVFASKNQLSDAILLNSHGRICESAIANIFVVKDNRILTPSLSEGPVAGVIRQFILSKAEILNYEMVETEIDLELLMTANEIFLSNALYPITPIRSIGEHRFAHTVSEHVYRELFEPFL